MGPSRLESAVDLWPSAPLTQPPPSKTTVKRQKQPPAPPLRLPVNSHPAPPDWLVLMGRVIPAQAGVGQTGPPAGRLPLTFGLENTSNTSNRLTSAGTSQSGAND